MRWRAIGVLLGGWCIGCGSTITREYVVDPAQVASYGTHAKVIEATRDRATVSVEFRPGDVVPDEGVVARRVSLPEIVVGSVSIIVGGSLALGGTLYQARTKSAFDDGSLVAFFCDLAGGTLILGGIITTIIGVIPKPTIIKRSGMTVAPLMTKTATGATLQITF